MRTIITTTNDDRHCILSIKYKHFYSEFQPVIMNGVMCYVQTFVINRHG